MFTNNRPQRNLFYDPSLWFLVLSNVLTIFFAIIGNWNLSTVLWVYWFQSIIIGFFNFVRILSLKEFSTVGFTINDQQVEPTQTTKIFTAFFFLFHYGFFHFVYFIFLTADSFVNSYGSGLNFSELKFVLLAALVFFINHLFSYIYNKPKDTVKQNIGSLMFYPYYRIIPMHIILIFGIFLVGALPIFLVLKTITDTFMHSYEHKVLRIEK